MNLYIPVTPIITVDDEKKLLEFEMNPNLVWGKQAYGPRI
jgi:hypothetical protein